MTRTASRRGGRRRVGTVWCLAVLLLGVCTGPAAADVQGVCDRARDLTTSGLPRQALALLERLSQGDGADTCLAEQRTAAVERIGAAEVLVGYAGGAPGGSRPACAGLPQDLNSNDWLAGARACDAENEDAAATSGSQDAETQLRQAVTQHVQPWEYAALTLLAVLVVGAVVARLLQRLVPVAWPWWRGRARLLRAAVVLAWSAFVVASGLLVLSALEEPVLGLPVVWVPVAAGLWGLAVLVLSWASARRMRLLLTVRRAPSESGESIEDKVATGHVLALVGELGSESPRGLEAVVGTDVTALSAAGLESAPQGKLASAVFQLLQVVWRQAPWEVTVSVVSEDLHTVHISRNGRHVRSAVVDRHSLGLGGVVLDPDGSATGRRPDLHRMTAAVVLCTLQEAYRFAGLGGATSWRSVGLQYIATTDHPGQPAEWELLARAVNDDPGNKAALLALWRARYRNSKDPDELAMYARLLQRYLRREHGVTMLPATGPDPALATLTARARRAWEAASAAWGEREDEPRPQALAQGDAGVSAATKAAARCTAPDPAEGEAALLLRALYAVVVAMVNGAYAAGLPDQPEAARPYLRLLRSLIKAQCADPRAEAHALACRLRDPVERMAGASVATTPPVTPVAHYQYACVLGSRPALDGSAAGADNAPAALRHLWVADADPDLATWRRDDPQLDDLRKEDLYLHRYGVPAVGHLCETPMFAPHADRLALMRILEPKDVIREAEAGTLDAALGVTPAGGERLAEFAALVLAVPAGLPRYEIAEALWSRGVSRVRGKRHGQLVPWLLEVLEHLMYRPTKEQLEAWLGKAPESAMNGATP